MTTEYPHGLTAGDTVLITGAEEISQHTPSGAAYDPVTGMFTITQNGHGFQVGEEVFFAEGSFTLRCALNSYADDHPYPRSTDPAGGGARLPIISTTSILMLLMLELLQILLHIMLLPLLQMQ